MYELLAFFKNWTHVLFYTYLSQINPLFLQEFCASDVCCQWNGENFYLTCKLLLHRPLPIHSLPDELWAFTRATGAGLCCVYTNMMKPSLSHSLVEISSACQIIPAEGLNIHEILQMYQQDPLVNSLYGKCLDVGGAKHF